MSEKDKKETSLSEEPQDATPPVEPEKEDPPTSYKRISFILSILLIFAGVVTMLNSWEVIRVKIYRQSNRIINAEFNRNQAELISQTSAQQNLTTYSYYNINIQLERQLDAALIEMETLQDEESDDFDPILYEQLVAEYNDALYLSDVQSFYFPTQYIGTDGAYDFEQNRLARYAEVTNRLEIDSDKIIAETDAMRLRKLSFMEATRLLGLSIAILGFEKVFYWKRRIVRYPIIVAGVSMLILGFLTYLSNNPDPISILF